MSLRHSLSLAIILLSLSFSVGSAFAFLVFLNFFYRYTWTGQNQFTRAIDYVLYYGFPLVVAVLFLASTKLKPIYRVNILVLCVSLSASVYAVELLLESMYVLPSEKKVKEIVVTKEMIERKVPVFEVVRSEEAA